MAVVVLWWSATMAKGSYSLRDPRRGERRSTTRMIATGGVSSPKRGRNGSGSNSNGGSDAPVTRRGHEDEGGENMGEKKGCGNDEATLFYQCGGAVWREWGPARDGATQRGGGGRALA
jgi:hypothetical protein